jgi:L-serine deaminase
MKVYRSSKGSRAIMVIETDQSVSDDVIENISSRSNVINAVSIPLM